MHCCVVVWLSISSRAVTASIPQQTLKTLFVEGEDNKLIALVLRGDHELNAVKAQKLDGVASPLTMAAGQPIFVRATWCCAARPRM